MVICFCFCSFAAAEAQVKIPAKQKGIFSDSFKKVKDWGDLQKTKLEIKYFEERLKKTPDDVELLKTYAKFLKDHKYYNESLKIYIRLVALTKNNIYKKDIAQIKSYEEHQKKEKIFFDYITKAQKYESKGNIVKANEYYLKAQAVSPERFEAKFGLAKTYCWLNNPKLSLKNYQDILKQSPNNIDVLEAYANCLKDSRKYSMAKQIYKKLFSLTKDEKYVNKLLEVASLEKGIKPKSTMSELAREDVENKTFFDYLKQAQEYESHSKIAKANEYYMKAYKQDPQKFEAKFGLAKTYGWLGKNKLALSYYKDLLKQSPNNPDLIAAYNKFLKQSKAPPAKPEKVHVEKNLNAEQDRTFSEYIKKAQDFEIQGKAVEANEFYLKAIGIYPARFEAKFGLAKTYGWLHKDELALKYYRELLAQSPNNPDLLAAYADYLKDTKHYTEAMEIYQKLLSQTKNEKYQANIAQIFFLQGDYQTSLKLYFDIYNQNPDNPEVQKAIALNYFVSGDFQKSIEFYEKYLVKNRDQESILNYAKSLFYSKEIKLAKKLLEYYVCAYPDDAEGFSTLSDVYVSEKDNQKAQQLVLRAISLKPENVKYQVQMAKLDIYAKNYCRAQTVLLQLLAMEPENAEVIEALGDISFYTDDFNQALNYYQCIPDYQCNKRLVYKTAQCHHYRKSYSVAQNLYGQLLCDCEYSNKSKIGLAEIQIEKDKPLKARSILKKVLKDDPENIQAKKNLAITYYSTGDNFKSIDILEKLPMDDPDTSYNLAKAYNRIERNDTALNLLRDNTQKNAKVLKSEILMQIRPAIEPFGEGYFMNAYGNPNAGQYLKLGGNGYYYLRPNMRLVGTATTTEYSNASNIVSTRGTLGSIGLEGRPTDHLAFKSAFGIDFFSNNGNRILGNAVMKYYPNDVVSYTTGYIRSLDEIDSYMSAAGVVPSVGPFANQLVGRIIDNKFLVGNLGFKLPKRFYAYAGFNVGYKYGGNSAPNPYREIPAGFGKVIYSAAENRPINQVLMAYDFYYTGYVNDMSGFGGANLAFSPIGSDGQQTNPTTGFPGTGGYFSPTFFIANKIPLTVKGSFKDTKLKYVLSGFVGTQTIQGQLPIAGIGPTGTSKLNVFPYFGCVVGLRYNEKGRYSWGLDYIFNNYMTVAQHTLRASLLIRF